MARVAGIQIEKDSKGRPAYARINLKKHGAAFLPQLNEMGAIEKSWFDKELETAISVNELKNNLYKKIDTLFDESSC